MLLSLDTIAVRRRALGITQTQLADMSAVSQSYIAKLEANRIEPSYSKVKAIFEALERLERRREIKAEEIMTPDIVCVQGRNFVYEAVALMRSHGYSQLPVFDEGISIGSITEKTIIDRMVSYDDQSFFKNKHVSEMMGDPFPQIGDDAPVTLVANMLKYYPAILVQRRGRIVGIITKADLLKTIG
jgi:predicted transcriptional regulator